MRATMRMMHAGNGPVTQAPGVSKTSGLPPGTIPTGGGSVQAQGPFTYHNGRRYRLTQPGGPPPLPTLSDMQQLFDLLSPGSTHVVDVSTSPAPAPLVTVFDWIAQDKTIQLQTPPGSTLEDISATPGATSSSPWKYLGIGAGLAALGLGGWAAYKAWF